MSFEQYYEQYKEKYAEYDLYKFAENSAELVFLKQYQARTTTGIHRHQYFQINYVSAGEGHHELAGRTQAVHKGDILIIPPYIPHRILANENVSCEIIEFEFALAFINQNFSDFSGASSFVDFAYLAPYFLPEEELQPRLTLSGRLQFEIEKILDEALTEFSEKRPGYLLLIRALLLRLLLLVGREYSIGQTDPVISQQNREIIWQAVQFMKEHCDQKLSLEQVAERFSFSPSHFSYLFKSVIGVPFSKHLITLRLNRAMHLLCETTLPVARVGELAGFQSAPHFFRCFREKTGQTPSGFRKKSTI
jgi:AraC-like DNA-binding protein/mannose-6-phosphate isomerase-like protein (cupin superfamily)